VIVIHLKRLMKWFDDKTLVFIPSPE